MCSFCLIFIKMRLKKLKSVTLLFQHWIGSKTFGHPSARRPWTGPLASLFWRLGHFPQSPDPSYAFGLVLLRTIDFLVHNPISFWLEDMILSDCWNKVVLCILKKLLKNSGVLSDILSYTNLIYRPLIMVALPLTVIVEGGQPLTLKMSVLIVIVI